MRLDADRSSFFSGMLRLVPLVKEDLVCEFSEVNIENEFDELLRFCSDQAQIESAFQVHPDVYHDGHWSALPLRSVVSADAVQEREGQFEWNEVADTKLPLTKSFLESLGDLARVRLLALPPKRRVYYHVDRHEGFDSEYLRFHIPIVVNSNANLVVNGWSYTPKAGVPFSAHFGLPHYIANMGEEVRIHLVADVKVKVPAIAIEVKERGLRLESAVTKSYRIHRPYNFMFDLKRYARIAKRKLGL